MYLYHIINNITKKFLLFLVLVIVNLSYIWAYQFSAIAPSGQTLYYNIVNGSAQVTYQSSGSSYYTNQPTGALTIPASVTYNGTTYSVTAIGSSAFDGCSRLTSVFIPYSVTRIGSSAFWSCSGLTNVFIPNSVTTIESYAFYECRSLTSVTIPNSVTSIGQHAFQSCNGLTSVTIPSSVTSIGGHAFYGCNKLRGVSIPNSVTSIGGAAFYGVNVVKYCGSSSGSPWSANRAGCFYENNGFIFEDNSQTTLLAYIGTNPNVTIPNSVIRIGEYAFRYCSSLTSVIVPNSVTSIGDGAFYYCSRLTSITIPNSVTTIGDGAFAGCGSLRRVSIGSSVTTIAASAFAGCIYMDTLYYNARNMITTSDWLNSSTSLGVQYGFRMVRYLEIGDGVQTLPQGVFYKCGVTSVTIPNSVTSIGNRAFEDCSSLMSVTIPNSVTSIGHTAFANCGSLMSVTIPNSVANIGSAVFIGCNDLTSMSVENGNTCYDSRGNCKAIIETSTNTLIAGCKNTTIPNSVTSIGQYAFDGCSGLTNVTIPNSVTRIGDYAFSGCSGLLSLTIGNSVNAIGNNILWKCDNLTSIIIEEGNNRYDSRNNCNAIIETSTNTLIAGCKSTTIPNSVTSIGRSAFLDCIGLTNVTIPNSVTSIGDYTFNGCININTIRLRCTAPPSIAGNSFSDVSNNALVKVPCGALQGYLINQDWSNRFTNIIESCVNVTTSVNEIVMGVVNGGGTYSEGDTVSLVAKAFPGNHFVGWSNGSTENPLIFVAESDISLMAIFDTGEVGIEEVMEAYKVASENGSISISGTSDQMLSIFDITGRIIIREKIENGKQYLMPHNGVYMVQVGNCPAQKVVVIK